MLFRRRSSVQTTGQRAKDSWSLFSQSIDTDKSTQDQKLKLLNGFLDIVVDNAAIISFKTEVGSSTSLCSITLAILSFILKCYESISLSKISEASWSFLFIKCMRFLRILLVHKATASNCTNNSSRGTAGGSAASGSGGGEIDTTVGSIDTSYHSGSNCNNHAIDISLFK